MKNQKELLQELAHKVEESIDTIRELQKQIHDILKDKTESEMEELKNDLELEQLNQRLTQKLSELW